MRMLSRIGSIFAFAGRASGGGRESMGVIIDAESLANSTGGGRQPSTQEKISILNRLALFREKERLPLTAVMSGPPLRVAADGDEFKEVIVRYVGSKDVPAQFIARLLKQERAGKDTVVVTADRQVERAVLAAGVQVMHTATFRKALEPADAGQVRQKNAGNVPASKQIDENKRIVNELIDPL